MAYDKDRVLQQCIQVIKEEKIIFFGDLAAFIEPTMSTLYEWEFEKSHDIKNELAKNRIQAKRKMRKHWQLEEAAPVLQLAAYKLMADKEELEALTMNKVDASVNGSLTVNWNEQKTYETKDGIKPY